MIYGFNDSKEKVEVYAKSDFVVITLTKQNVAAGELAMITIPDSGLASMGINPAEINKYAVLCAEQKIGTDGGYYSGIVDSTTYDFAFVYPRVTKIMNGSMSQLRIYVKNSDDTAQNVTARVVLMKVE